MFMVHDAIQLPCDSPACIICVKVMMKLQLPEGLEDEMQVMMLDKLLGAKFFEILRTQ